MTIAELIRLLQIYFIFLLFLMPANHHMLMAASETNDDIAAKIKEQLKNLDKPIVNAPSHHGALPDGELREEPGTEKSESTSAAHKQKEGPAKITARADYKADYNEINVDFSFTRGVPYYAVFSMEDTWYVVFSSPTEFTQGEYDPEKFKNLDKITTQQLPNGFVYKIKFKEKMFPKIEFEDKNDIIHLTFLPKGIQEDRSFDIIVPRNTKIPFRVRQKNGKVDLDFEDDEENIHLWVICAGDSNKPLHARSYPDFQILESYQGLAFNLLSDNLSFSYVRHIAEISNPDGLNFSPSTFREPPIKQISFFKDFDPQSAPRQITDLSHAQTLDRIQNAFELIWLYLGLGRTAEALDYIKQIKEGYPDLLLIPAFRAMDGLAQLLMYRCNRAERILSYLSYDREPQFWSAVAGANRNAYVESDCLHKLPQFRDQLELLPERLRPIILVQILQVGILQHNTDVLKAFMDPASKINDAFFQIYLELAKAIIDLSMNDERALDKLEKVAHQVFNLKASTIAEFERMKFLRKQKKIDSAVELKTLDQLRFRWRGDLLEYHISKYLAERYSEEKQYNKALPLLRKITKYYPGVSHEDRLPDKMRETLIKYFDQKPSPPVLQALSIFQEFGDIAPDNEEGDRIMVQATNPMVNLELYDEVIGILEDYLHVKLKTGGNISRRSNAIEYRIAAIKLLKGKPGDTVKVLNALNPADNTLADDVAILKSEAFVRLGDMDAALGSLSETPRQLQQKALIYFMNKKWPEAEGVYEKLISVLGDHGDKDTKLKAIINLALCCALEKNKDKLKELNSNFAHLLSGSKLEPAFTLLTDSTANVDPAQLESVIKSEPFIDSLKKMFEN